MEKCYSGNFSELYSLTDVSYRVPYLPKSDRKSRDYFDFIAPLSTDPSSKFPFRNNPTHLRLQYLINPKHTLSIENPRIWICDLKSTFTTRHYLNVTGCPILHFVIIGQGQGLRDSSLARSATLCSRSTKA